MTDERRSKQVFVIAPIGADGSDERLRSNKVLQFIIREALLSPDFTVRRADEESSPDQITSLVVKRIREADLVVADITGHNPNVFYELAIAHGYQRPVVHLGEKGERLPFDIADMRTIWYDVADLYSVKECVDKVRAAARVALEDPSSLKTPLTALDPFSAIREQANPGSADEAIAKTLQTILSRIESIEHALPSALRHAARAGAVARRKRDEWNVERYIGIRHELDALRAELANDSLPPERQQDVARHISKLEGQLTQISAELEHGSRPTPA